MKHFLSQMKLAASKYLKQLDLIFFLIFRSFWRAFESYFVDKFSIQQLQRDLLKMHDSGKNILPSAFCATASS